jgi:hypothetical protein
MNSAPPIAVVHALPSLSVLAEAEELSSGGMETLFGKGSARLCIGVRFLMLVLRFREQSNSRQTRQETHAAQATNFRGVVLTNRVIMFSNTPGRVRTPGT